MTDSPADLIHIATRSSQLALWQANHVADLLRATVPDCQVELVHISTQGDRDQQESLRQFGGMGVFTREVQKAVLDGRADLAVHSLKDLPTESAEGLTLAGIPERASRIDALVLPKDSEKTVESLLHIKQGAKIGTGSPRRQAQLLHLRDDFEVAEIRGNVETRLKKLDDGEYDAIILAVAGLTRLGFADRISLPLEPPEMFPAVGQGALGLECREDDERLISILQSITHEPTQLEVLAERSLLRELRAGCHAPLGTLTTLSNTVLHLHGVVLSLDGTERLFSTAETDSAEGFSRQELAVKLGIEVANELREQGVERLL